MPELIYRKIQNHICELIRTRELIPGQSLPSERSLGARFNASQIPVRKALSELVEDGTLHHVPGKGTFVSPDLVAKTRTHRIAVVHSFSDVDFSASPVYTMILSGINREAQHQNRLVLLRALTRDGVFEPESVFLDIDEEVDGFIVVNPVISQVKALETASRKCTKPIVVVNFEGVVENVEQISFDSREGARKMVSFLHREGHRRIAYVYHYTEHFGGAKDPNQANRIAGYREGMAEFGLSEEKWLCRLESLDDMETLRRFMSKPDRPSVIFASHDDHARFLYKQLRSLGYRVPNDIAVVGYDGIQECEYLSPILTSVRTPLREMGALGVRFILERRAGGAGALRRTVLVSDMRVGESHVSECLK